MQKSFYRLVCSQFQQDAHSVSSVLTLQQQQQLWRQGKAWTFNPADPADLLATAMLRIAASGSKLAVLHTLTKGSDLLIMDIWRGSM